MEPWQVAAAYHERTKHHYDHYARSLGRMDWANQPDPFRRFHGAPLTLLPLSQADFSPKYDHLFGPVWLTPQPLNVDSLGLFFERSLAISAWKEYGGTRWALRVNPSSGNLHPTEAYAVLPAMKGFHDHPGIYHYAPRVHGLERRSELPEEMWASLTQRNSAGTFLVGLSSIHWREAWKYGERAYRYCQHDAGHALAALAIAAATLGWRTRMLEEESDADVAALLGLDRAGDFENAERENPDLLAAVRSNGHARDAVQDPSAEFIEQIAAGQWSGTANRLSAEHVEWEVIRQVETACVKRTADCVFQTRQIESDGSNAPGPAPPASRPPTAHKIIRQRRSALAMDGRTSIDAHDFYSMLARVMPDPRRPPWSAMGAPAFVDLGLFVHRVRGIPPGLYCLVRNPAHDGPLRSAMHAAFQWNSPTGCPDQLPLYLLQPCDCRALAARVSCGQDIAGDGAFSLGMIAEFEAPLKKYGAWLYRRLFWETGMIGQVLYLEAEAAGIRSTGIGCFFDDPVHEAFGLEGTQFQSLYHFTVGGHVDDPRLTTLPAYDPALRPS